MRLGEERRWSGEALLGLGKALPARLGKAWQGYESIDKTWQGLAGLG